MKRQLWMILAVLSVLCSCVHRDAGSGNGDGASRSESKQITIAVSEDSDGNYIIDEPAPSASRAAKEKQIHWRFVNNCSDGVVVESVLIHTFKDENTTDPKPLFEDASTEYPYTLNLAAGREKGGHPTSKVSKDAAGHSYTYKITATLDISGTKKTVTKDPKIVVTR